MAHRGMRDTPYSEGQHKKKSAPKKKKAAGKKKSAPKKKAMKGMSY